MLGVVLIHPPDGSNTHAISSFHDKIMRMT